MKQITSTLDIKKTPFDYYICYNLDSERWTKVMDGGLLNMLELHKDFNLYEIYNVKSEEEVIKLKSMKELTA